MLSSVTPGCLLLSQRLAVHRRPQTPVHKRPKAAVHKRPGCPYEAPKQVSNGIKLSCNHGARSIQGGPKSMWKAKSLINTLEPPVSM